MTGDTWDPAKLEGLRELIDIYHYLHQHGVVGRWVRVYRPVVAGDDPTMYFQRLSGDRRRGIIIPKRPAPGPVTIKPKGLLPAEKYPVTFQESSASEERSGTDLMDKGIVLEKMAAGGVDLSQSAPPPGQQAGQGAAHRPEQRARTQRRRTSAIRGSN